MRKLYEIISDKTSKMVTQKYSTSFSLGILFLDRKIHKHIYAIYGFVRFADEIVDTFHEFDKKTLLQNFREDTFRAIEQKISLNPILHSFQKTVNEYKIEPELINTFLDSMAMDIDPSEYDSTKYEEYIFGSAEVVGLMCLKVFCQGDSNQYEQLSYEAKKLGSAFQKVNFLRDLQNDYYQLGRIYFPGVEINEFNDEVKAAIEENIEEDFKTGLKGILKLPKNSRFGVYLAYVYYYALFQRIKAAPAAKVLKNRIRIPNFNKYSLLISSYFRHSFNNL